MGKTTIPRGRGKHEDGDAHPSTRALTVDRRFAEVLAEDLGLKVRPVRIALEGEPKVRAVRVSEWAMRNAPDDLEHRAKLLLWWAKKRKAGAFREDKGGDTSLADIFDQEQDRFERLAEALAAMWVEHPESLAEAIRALEEQRSGNGRS